jgi:hypothetical protein
MVPHLSDDRLIELLKAEFKTDDQQQFLINFQLYLQYGDDNTAFVIDLDNNLTWLGYTTKGKAKSFLLKHFEKDVDYKIRLPQPGRSGGQNKEEILMNVETFKGLCMLSNTEKGKQTRRYYAKMESIFFKYLKEKNDDQLILLQSHFEDKKASEIHNKLIEAHPMTPLLYVARVYRHKNGYYIKIGETDNARGRIATLMKEYPDIQLLEVFVCECPHAFEQMIFKNEIFIKNRYKGREVFKLNETFDLNFVITFIKKNIKYYSGIMGQRRRLEMMRIEERSKILDLLKTTPETDKRDQLFQMLNNIENTVRPETTESDDEKESLPFRQRSVFKYDPGNLKDPVETFRSLRQAARSLNNPQYHDYHIRNASIHNTIFEGYRWFLIDGDEDRPEEIALTKSEEGETSSKRQKGLIVQIDKEKTKIINVFASQRDAEKETKVPNCQISTGISTGRLRHGFYWNFYDNCTDELKRTFEGVLPEPQRVATCSKKVQRIDPMTMTVLETYPCIQDVCNAYSCCHKSIKQSSASGNIFKNFIWKLGD